MGDVSLDFRLLFEASPDILLVLLPDAPRFTMVAATDARLNATHTTRENTVGRGLFEMFPDNPDDPAATGTNNLRASLERVCATRAPDTMAVQKYDIRGADGSFVVKYWSPKNLPVLGPGGELRYILHRVEDVTELVHASEVGQELRGRAQAMEREVITRSRELAHANHELRDANDKLQGLDRAKTSFFSNVSHEFRTPLTLILGPVEHALTRDGALAGDDLAAVHRNTVRLLHLVNDLLDFSRIVDSGVSLRFAPTELGFLTAGLAGAFQSMVEDAGMKLRVNCPPLPEPVYVDRPRWEKVVLNLISNAFKFTLEGEIAVALSWHGDHVELSVRDTGIGIPEGQLSQLFERFHRVEGARGRSIEGSGIGLALVREIAELHAGSVQVSSVENQGTTFTVSIPTGARHLAPDQIASESEVGPWVPKDVARLGALLGAAHPPEVTPPAEVAPAARSAASEGRVLVADDNPDMRSYVRRLLEPYYEVQAVADGKAAFEAARRSPPDLIVSDVMMPEMDGVALVAALRKEPVTHTIPVLLLSARAGEEAVVDGLETGADDYLVKPFSARELLGRVRSHLAMTRMRKEAEDAMRQLAETRAALVRELEGKNAELEAAYRELQTAQARLVQSAKMASLGELVAGVAHEINNPLAFIVGHLATVQRSLARVHAQIGGVLNDGVGADWKRANERLNEMQLGLDRIRDLVLRLRTFSRLDEGEQKTVSMRETVESVLTIIDHRLRDRVDVVTEFGDPDQVTCYPGLLNQALLNLLTNAADAIDGHGSILLRAGAQASQYVIAVADTGCGIPEPIRDRVIEPFFTTKPVGSGTGLGLPITYSIAKKHGGDLELVPRDEGGTVAILRFPLV